MVVEVRTIDFVAKKTCRLKGEANPEESCAKGLAPGFSGRHGGGGPSPLEPLADVAAGVLPFIETSEHRLVVARACTLLHVSCSIGRPMPCHIRFLMMWRRESEEAERGRCFAKQPPHEQNNHLMRQLHNHCMSCCYHATHNILFYMHKLRDFIILPDDL
jgi:hypothetical protein